MTVREATLEDWSYLTRFVEEMNLERVELYHEPDYARLHLATIKAALEHQLGGVYIAESEYGGEPIGFTAMLRFPEMPENMAEGIGTYVSPEHRRAKVAHELGVACREFHRARGVRVIRGSVYLENSPSIARCLAEGAKITGFLLEYPIEGHEG